MLFTKYAKYSSRRFCPVCKKNGKPESEYLSHNTRDENENVICPVLLSVVCNYCKETGHIVANCPNKRPFGNSPRTNRFSSLCEETEVVQELNEEPEVKVEEEVVKPPEVDNFPALTSLGKKSPTQPTANSYSNMASCAKIQETTEAAKAKHYSPTCEEIETRLRNLILSLECEKEHTNRFNGGTVYFTREQLRERLNKGLDVDTDKVYLIDEHDGEYSDDDGGQGGDDQNDYDYDDDDDDF